MSNKYRFGRQILGYKRMRVDTQLKVYESEIGRLNKELANLKAEMLRADHMPENIVPPNGAEVPLTVIIGPVEKMADVDRICTKLDDLQAIDVKFRAFSFGFYRIDGSVRNMQKLIADVTEIPYVATVNLGEHVIHLELANSSAQVTT